ncbi:SdiA-regulated domain-containing protein [Salinimicrobium xinjiangense]|uniref:SdiA-regulated domain-containing protein n=1 Tax=Salinimicrobium xinjiangense TaxID=438596 RepID=UPI0003F81FF5|nr:SdiA-regulated domain-containing protein [Salinimicrobium xinjiangense]
MKKVIFGILVLIGTLSMISACKGKASELEREPLKYKILEKWDLPEALNEVSGIAWIGEDRIACVQDEDGIIFIYNLKNSRVEKEIKFGSGGDYEGIAIVGKDAYVLRSDGIIIVISGFMKEDPQVQKHVTNLNRLPGINIEGICADPANNRLLLAVKDRKGSSQQKEIYAIDIIQKASASGPLFTVNFSDPIFQKVKEKEKFSPGEINIHPERGEYYILDGTRPKILITEQDGTPKELFILTPEEFGNPEGLTFNPEGDLYISNEAENAPANILKVVLNRK